MAGKAIYHSNPVKNKQSTILQLVVSSKFKVQNEALSIHFIETPEYCQNLSGCSALVQVVHYCGKTKCCSQYFIYGKRENNGQTSAPQELKKTGFVFKKTD
jgi:hypothetical protein